MPVLPTEERINISVRLLDERLMVLLAECEQCQVDRDALGRRERHTEAIKMLRQFEGSRHTHAFSEGRNSWYEELEDQLTAINSEVVTLQANEDFYIDSKCKDVQSTLRQLGRIFRDDFNINLGIEKTGFGRT